MSQYRYKIGQKVNERYEVLEPIGSGAVGEVYKVLDKFGQTEDEWRIRALKLSLEINQKERFVQEARIMQDADHPNIVKIYDVADTGEDYYFLVMEHMAGGALTEYIGRNKLTLEQVQQILIQIAAALKALHSRDIIHRDLKPDNILVTEDFPINETVKITDFGVAKDKKRQTDLTNHVENLMIGTIRYIAPEQCGSLTLEDHNKITGAADIYSFGIIAFELLTGEHPYREYETSPYMLINAHSSSDVPVPRARSRNKDIPRWLDELVYGCMQKNLSDRYKSIDQVVRSLSANKAEPRIKVMQKQAAAAVLSTIIALITVYMSVAIPGYEGSGRVGAVFERGLLGIFYKIRGDVDAPQDVILISMDDISRDKIISERDGEELSPFEPWPRRYHAEILEKIAPLKPKMVIFDIRFSKPREPFEDDNRLVQAFQLVPTYIMGGHIHRKKQSKQADVEVYDFKPHAYFADRSKGIYIGNLRREGDKIWRFNYYLKDNQLQNPLVETLRSAGLSDVQMPSPHEYIWYYGGPESIKTYSMRELLTGIQNENVQLKDKYVVIGEASSMQSGTQVRDTFPIPASSDLVTGEEVHATMLQNILRGKWIRRLAGYYEFLMILILTIIMSYFCLRKPIKAVQYILIVSVLWLAAAYMGFQYSYLIVGHLMIINLVILLVLMRLLNILLPRYLKNAR